MRALLLYELALAILLQNQQVPSIDYNYLPVLPDEKLAARGQVAAETKLIVDPNKIFEDIAESESKEAKDALFGAGSTDEDYLFGRKQKLSKAQSAQLNQKRIIQQQKQQREAELARKRAEAEAAKDK